MKFVAYIFATFAYSILLIYLVDGVVRLYKTAANLGRWFFKRISKRKTYRCQEKPQKP